MRVLFIADQFADSHRDEKSHYPGGAELTDQAAIEACPWPITCAHTAEFQDGRRPIGELEDFDVHVIGNFESAREPLRRRLEALGRHVLFEHDVRICRWRGNFLGGPGEYSHRYLQRCNCPHPELSRLFHSALGSIVLTHRQLAVYQTNAHFRPRRMEVVGSSLMNRAFFERLDAAQPQEVRHRAAVLGSRQDIKGFARAQAWCREQGWEPFVIRDIPPEQVLEELASTRTFVYLPEGLEPSGRMLLEARFLGCEIIANPNVGVCGESWWNLEDRLAREVVRDAPARFWRLVARLWEHRDGRPNGPSGPTPMVDKAQRLVGLAQRVAGQAAGLATDAALPTPLAAWLGAEREARAATAMRVASGSRQPTG